MKPHLQKGKEGRNGKCTTVRAAISEEEFQAFVDDGVSLSHTEHSFPRMLSLSEEDV